MLIMLMEYEQRLGGQTHSTLIFGGSFSGWAFTLV